MLVYASSVGHRYAPAASKSRSYHCATASIVHPENRPSQAVFEGLCSALQEGNRFRHS